MKIETMHPPIVSAPTVARNAGVTRRPWRIAGVTLRPHCIWALLASAFFLASPAFCVTPSISAALEPAEIRPGAFTTFTITVENGTPDGAPKLKLPDGLEATTDNPAFGQQTTIENGNMRQASTLTWQINCTKVGEYVIPSQELPIRGQIFKTNEVRLVVKENPAYPVSKFDPLLTLEVDKREFY